MVKILLLTESYEDKISDTNPYPLRPGMSATAEIQTDRKTGIYSIPIQAVTTRMDTTGTATEKEDQQIGSVSSDGTVSNETLPSESKTTSDEPMVVVFIVSEGKAWMKEVKTGIQDNNNIEITEGLDHDAQVIVAPYSAISRQLKNDLNVEVVSEEALFEGDKNKKD
jgi:HlyD family secretion protein